MLKMYCSPDIRIKQSVSELADIRTGYQFRKKLVPDHSGDHAVIQIRDFDADLNLDSENLVRVQLEKVAADYYVRKGDVLFLSRGSRNWAAAVSEDLQATVAASHFFMLRPRQADLLPEYLAWYINQPPAQEFLHSQARRGTHMPLIPLSAFRYMPIEVPAIDTQKTIVELSRLAGQEKKLLAALQEKQAQFVSAVSLKASKGKKEKAK